MDKEFELDLIWLAGVHNVKITQRGQHFYIPLSDRLIACLVAAKLQANYPYIRAYVRNDVPTITIVNTNYSTEERGTKDANGYK